MLCLHVLYRKYYNYVLCVLVILNLSLKQQVDCFNATATVAITSPAASLFTVENTAAEPNKGSKLTNSAVAAVSSPDLESYSLSSINKNFSGQSHTKVKYLKSSVPASNGYGVATSATNDVASAAAVAATTKPSQEMVSVSLSGDIILGGLFPVHEKGENTPCGPKIYNRGVHRLEAMLYAIDRVNNDTNLLPGITIGVHILDTCSRDTYALNQSLQFVRASLNNLDTSSFECPDNTVPRLRNNATSGPVFGVIGGSYSSVSLQVANLLRLFHIPQISPASTAKTLSDKTRFDLFARTVPPDTFQSVALVDIIKGLNWSYVSTIHSEGSYGEYGIEAFHKEASERNVCIAAAEKVPSAADDRVFDAIINKLQKKINARGVVLFTRAEDARSILLAAKRANLTHPFHWIASDGWGKQQKLLEGLEDIAEGAITVELQSELIEDFDRYMMQLTPQTNKRNPWFEEYWEDTFNCVLEKNFVGMHMSTYAELEDGNTDELDKLKIPQHHHHHHHHREDESEIRDSSSSSYSNIKTKQRRAHICNDNYRLSEKVGYEQESKTQFVIDAVYAFAHALHKLHRDLCAPKTDAISNISSMSYQNENTYSSTMHNGTNGAQRHHHHTGSAWYRKPIDVHTAACPEMANYDGKDFYNNYLLNVSFIDLAGSVVKFDRQGDGLARYDILNYQRLENSSGYHYKVVGKWFNQLEMNIGDVLWNRETEIPISACSLPCEAGMIKKQQGDTCCWICDNCEAYEYVFDEFTCKDCGPGYWPYPDKLSCFALDVQYMRWKSLFALIPMAIAIIGTVMTVIVIVLFAKNHDTPLVRASGRELSYMLLFGILVCYCNTFALIAKPTIISCVVQRFGIGVGFSIIYGALLTKTNRISRIFHSASRSAQRLSYISPQSQVVITASLIGIQIFITVVWMIVEPPGTRFYYPDRTEVILKCKIQDMSFLFSQLYNMILITICTVYAIKTRKIPENFNESKFIGFTMYTTCIIWLAFVPIYFGTGNSYEIQITTLCVSISLSASVALICLYSPKVYILVFHPDKNVRKLTMNSTVYRRSTTAAAAAASHGGTAGSGGAGGCGGTSGASRTAAVAPQVSNSGCAVVIGDATVTTIERTNSLNQSQSDGSPIQTKPTTPIEAPIIIQQQSLTTVPPVEYNSNSDNIANEPTYIISEQQFQEHEQQQQQQQQHQTAIKANDNSCDCYAETNDCTHTDSSASVTRPTSTNLNSDDANVIGIAARTLASKNSNNNSTASIASNSSTTTNGCDATTTEATNITNSNNKCRKD